jgi:hypothetical protein
MQHESPDANVRWSDLHKSYLSQNPYSIAALSGMNVQALRERLRRRS